jgi:nicotinate phosphoribosyltransferase
LAGQAFDIPVYGTAAHSFIMSFPHEIDAFRAYHDSFPGHDTLLIDTYDTIEGARRAVAVGSIAGVRLDSGDLAALSIQVRRILNEAGQPEARIVASGDLDEFRIAALLEAGAQIDVFGVGTELITSRDAPALGGVYKLVAINDGREDRPVSKRSQDKVSLPGRKQVYRTRGSDGQIAGDTLALADEAIAGEPLLAPVIRAGSRLTLASPLTELQARALENRDALPATVRRLRDPESCPVRMSSGLAALSESLARGTDA